MSNGIIDDQLLFEIGSAMRQAVVDYYEREFLPATHELPDRQYVSDGLPAYDSAQLTVHCTRTFTVDDTGNETANFPIGPLIERGAEFVVTLLRDTPVEAEEPDYGEGTPPDPDEIEAVAKRVLSDAERVTDAIIQAFKAGELPAACHGLYFAGWTGYGPEGGLSGGATIVRVRLQ